ncbi:MAG: TonB family protein, partial [Bacteroidetes bacterium]|nr:TonB family protein [Bacteroidota bacterium]
KISEEINYKDSQKDGYAKYSRKGAVYEEGSFLNGKNDGVWIYYYPTGELNSKINFKNGEKNGEGVYYYKDGTISQKGQFVIGEKSGMWMAYDEKGAIASELNYNSNKLDGDARYYEKGKLVCSGKHNKGVRIFVWKFYNAKGKETSVYDYGYTFVSSKDTPPQPPSVNDVVKVSESPLAIVDIMPVFPGGENMMMEFIQKNIVYPQKEKESAIQGIVYVSFVVDNLGEISNVKILRGVPGGAGCDQEAKRIVEIMPRWTPGMQNGRPVPVSFNLPIKYKLR